MVLVADDDADMLQLMVRRLTKQGFEIVQASDGRSAVQKLGEGGYDLVVTDIYMPGVTGLELLQQAKEADPHMQVIVVTAGATLENAIQALNNGAFAYLHKPFDHFSVFDTTVSRAMQFRQALRDNERMAEIQRRRGDMLEEEVTERVQQLQKRRREMLNLLAALPDGVVVVEGSGRIMMTNPVADDWLALDQEDPEHPIHAYLETLEEEWTADEWEVELDGQSLQLVTSMLEGRGAERRVVTIRPYAGGRAAIGAEEALDMLGEAHQWLLAHPMRRAIHDSLNTLEGLILEMRAQLLGGPAAEAHKPAGWNTLELNGEGAEPSLPDSQPTPSPDLDTLFEEDLESRSGG